MTQLHDILKGSPKLALQRGVCVRHEDRQAVTVRGGIPLCRECADEVRNESPKDAAVWAESRQRESSIAECQQEVGPPHLLKGRRKKKDA